MRVRPQHGFTIIELIASMAIFGIIASIGLANVAQFNAQLRAGQEARRLALTISSLRNEAIRLRASVRVTFSSSGYEWDFHDDGTTEGSSTLAGGTAWPGSVPTAFVINGLGLLQGAAAEQTISISKGDSTVSVSVNQNGYVSL